MAVHIRLARHGSKKNPYYRIVVTDHHNPRDGRFIESIGTYDPGADPGLLKVDASRYEYWTKQGAQPSHTVERLLKQKSAPAAAHA
jgi:small subunit ribosomal protein S16